MKKANNKTAPKKNYKKKVAINTSFDELVNMSVSGNPKPKRKTDSKYLKELKTFIRDGKKKYGNNLLSIHISNDFRIKIIELEGIDLDKTTLLKVDIVVNKSFFLPNKPYKYLLSINS